VDEVKNGYILQFWAAMQFIDQEEMVSFSDALECLEAAMAFGTADTIVFWCIDQGEVLYVEEYFRIEEWFCYKMVHGMHDSLVTL
jgi:hypothetical protein